MSIMQYRTTLDMDVNDIVDIALRDEAKCVFAKFVSVACGKLPLDKINRKTAFTLVRCTHYAISAYKYDLRRPYSIGTGDERGWMLGVHTYGKIRYLRRFRWKLIKRLLGFTV